MPGAALRSGPASAPSAAQYVAVQPAARGSVTEAKNDWRERERLSHSVKPQARGTTMNKEVVAILVACSLAACAQPPAPQQQAAPPPVPAAPPEAAAPPTPPVTSEAQIAPGRWDVERVRCSDLLGASDDDRAAAAMFYYGYLAAKAGIHVIAVSRIDANIAKVMNVCADAPNITITSAFYRALRSSRSQ